MALFKKKSKDAEPTWFTNIKNDIYEARKNGEHTFYGYVPVGQEKLLMRLPPGVMFRLDMRVENNDGAEYYYKFTIE